MLKRKLRHACTLSPQRTRSPPRPVSEGADAQHRSCFSRGFRQSPPDPSARLSSQMIDGAGTDAASPPDERSEEGGMQLATTDRPTPRCNNTESEAGSSSACWFTWTKPEQPPERRVFPIRAARVYEEGMPCPHHQQSSSELMSPRSILMSLSRRRIRRRVSPMTLLVVRSCNAPPADGRVDGGDRSHLGTLSKAHRR